MYLMQGNERMLLTELERETGRLASEVAAGRETQAAFAAASRRAIKRFKNWLRGVPSRPTRPSVGKGLANSAR